jgi:hypothetical protein
MSEDHPLESIPCGDSARVGRGPVFAYRPPLVDYIKCVALAISLLAVSAAAFDAAGREPSITIVSPQSTVRPISTPVRIEVACETSPGARIVPDTFKVLYGLFKIDVTAKIRPYAVVSEHGLLAEKAALPPGTHRLFLQISDSAGRTAESEVKFSVAP